MKVLVIVGSRNHEGQTAQAAGAVLEGIRRAQGDGESVYLPELKIERCRQCDPDGWGLCRRSGQCVIEDDFAGLAKRLKLAHAAVLATPVYFSDLSESLRAFLDRLRRICIHESGKKGLSGKRVVGVCVAGGGGGGAPACAVSLERVLATCGCDVVDMVPVRRQNLQMKLDVLRTAGAFLAGQVQ